MRYAAFPVLMLIVLFSACNRDVEGCRDPASVNFNPDATVDDGSCEYEVDRFCGNWTLTDTVVNQVTMSQEILTRTLVIGRIDAHKVRISVLGGSSCLADVYAIGSGNALTIASADNDEFYCNHAATISGAGQLSGNVLTISYFWNYFMPNMHDLSGHGKAIKQ